MTTIYDVSCARAGRTRRCFTLRAVHGSPSEWGKLVSKRILERHPLYSPSKGMRTHYDGLDMG